MHFSILGPLSAWKEDREIKLSTRRSRVTLGHLLIERGRYVRAEQIISCLYGKRMPKSAMNQLHRGISELRMQGIPIETKQHSYKLTAPPESVDSHHFSTLCDSARHAMEEGRPADAADLYTEALGLWRGSALGDLESHQLSLHSDYWNELRISAQEACIDADISCGRHKEIIPKIQIIQAENPLREHFSAQLMVALYLSGRASEALDTYTSLREMLRDSLGMDPSPRVEKTYLSILRQDSEIEFP